MPRASRIVFVVRTDGEENSSREFKDRIVKMIKQKIDADNWKYVFLSADPDAAMAYKKSGMGIQAARVSLASIVAAHRSWSGQ